MKNKFLLCVFILTVSIVKAQDTRSLYQQHADSLFQHLDKIQIPMGILYDRVAQFADLDTLSGLITNNTNPAIKTSSVHFLQAWKELYDASYNQSNLVKPEWLNALITEKRMANIVPIGVLNYLFNVLDSGAIQKNLIYLGTDSLLYDVAGRPESPYYTREIFLASPLLSHIQPGTVTFQFPSAMLLQNNPVTITSLYIDFGEGQTATLYPGGSATVQIQQTGIKTIILTANLSNGSQKIIRAILEVDAPSGSSFEGSSASKLNREPVTPCITKRMQANIPFADYTTGENKKGEIDVGYYFANCATQQLLKPIIILDGFDPGDDREIFEIYDLLYYNTDNSNFGQEMRQLGYDVLVVNFPTIIESYRNTIIGPVPDVIRDGGAEYIERNAMAIVKLIDSVNQVLINNDSREKLVIVGPSMGGLITRYALAYMEKNGLNHNTRLWTSFDSPHWGANIPIGDQYWLEYYARVGGKAAAKKSLEEQIGSVAARQMLIHHWTAQSVTPAPNAFRTQFMNNLTSNGVSGSNGFPQSLRKISLTNGSGSGAVQPQGNACGKVLHLDAHLRQWVWFSTGSFASAIVRHHISESNVYFTPDYGNTCKVFDGWYKIGRWGRRPYEEKFAQTPSNTKSYDRVPGGKFNTQDEIRTQGEKLKWIEGVFSNVKFSDVINNHAFIPTVSSLSLTNHDTRDWSENLSTRNLVCSEETPFNAYYTPTNNEDHVFLNSSNVSWIKNEITNQQPTTLTGYYRISSNYHNPGYQYPLGPNNPFFLPTNQGFTVYVYITNPDVPPISWTRSGYPFSWYHNTNGRLLNFSGTSGSTAYSQRMVTFNSTTSIACVISNQSFNFSVITQGWGFFGIVASPNPATDDLNVTISDESKEVESLSKDEDVLMQLYEVNTNLLVTIVR